MSEGTSKTMAEELEALRGKRGPKASADPQAAKDRNIKMAKAAGMASSMLRHQHKDEYDTYYERAKKELGL